MKEEKLNGVSTEWAYIERGTESSLIAIEEMGYISTVIQGQ